MTEPTATAAEPFDPTKIEGHTPDFRTKLAAQLAELAPEAVADGKIDVDKLKELLDGDAEDTTERFGLFWPGKKRAIRAAQTPTAATLAPDYNNSKNWDTTQNVFIEGDNLEVLKILQKHYHGKIKMIYIDPPYNTGKDFVYPDNFKDGVDHYLQWSKQVNEDGKPLSTNTETGGRIHTNWLNMMYPRLKLARNLLTQDGVIFISIDDQEIAQLRKLCDEIFGEENLIGQITWMRKRGLDNSAQFVSRNHEYCLIYARRLRQAAFQRLPLREETKKAYTNPDNDERGPYRLLGTWARGSQGGSTYAYTAQDGTIFSERTWLMNEQSMRQADLDGRLVFRGDKVYRKLYLEESRGAVAPTIWDDTSNAANGADEIKALFEFQAFDTVKPLPYIKRMLQLATKPTDIVLDFFSGSGTTAHAVMQLNAEDGGNRRHIQVQLPEPTPEGSKARSAGYDTIADIARERIRRAGEKIEADHAEALAQREHPLDTGFRAYKLVDTNFKQWDVEPGATAAEVQQGMLNLRDSARDDATTDELLTELLLKQGMSLTEHVTDTQISGLDCKTITDADGNIVLLAYVNEHTPPTIDQLREMVDTKPARLVILEDCFQGNDELKTNLKQMCATHNIELKTA